MDRPLLLALASAGAGILSFSTLLLPTSGSLGHLAENATWGFLVGVVILAALALDGAHARRDVRAVLVLGVAAAGVRAMLLFVPAP